MITEQVILLGEIDYYNKHFNYGFNISHKIMYEGKILIIYLEKNNIKN